MSGKELGCLSIWNDTTFRFIILKSCLIVRCYFVAWFNTLYIKRSYNNWSFMVYTFKVTTKIYFYFISFKLFLYWNYKYNVLRDIFWDMRIIHNSWSENKLSWVVWVHSLMLLCLEERTVVAALGRLRTCECLAWLNFKNSLDIGHT